MLRMLMLLILAASPKIGCIFVVDCVPPKVTLYCWPAMPETVTLSMLAKLLSTVCKSNVVIVGESGPETSPLYATRHVPPEAPVNRRTCSSEYEAPSTTVERKGLGEG